MSSPLHPDVPEITSLDSMARGFERVALIAARSEVATPSAQLTRLAAKQLQQLRDLIRLFVPNEEDIETLLGAHAQWANGDHDQRIARVLDLLPGRTCFR